MIGIRAAIFLVASAAAGPTPEAARVDRLMAVPEESCRADGITVQGGLVTDAAFYREMAGFAASAGTTGGLKRKRFLVTRNDDPAKAAPSGTLRAAVEQANAAGGGWIAFAPSLRGKTITLSAPLRLGSNITIDGGCARPHIVGAAPGSLIYLRGNHNVVISRLAMEHAAPGTQGDCITVSHGADRVWLSFLRLRRCHDGLIDVTRNDAPGPMRVTISNNRLLDHNKAILTVGGPIDRSCALSRQPVQVTIFRNVFLRTGQRHPRASGDVFVDIVQNVISFGPQRRASNEGIGGSYGTLATDGAHVRVDETVYLPPAGPKRYRIAATDAGPEGGAKRPCANGSIDWVNSAVTKPERVSLARADTPSSVRPYRLRPIASPTPQGLIDYIVPRTGPAAVGDR